MSTEPSGPQFWEGQEQATVLTSLSHHPHGPEAVLLGLHLERARVLQEEERLTVRLGELQAERQHLQDREDALLAQEVSLEGSRRIGKGAYQTGEKPVG